MPWIGAGSEPASARGGRGYRFTPAERDLLLGLQRQALQYFVDNQVPCGLVLDRQSNRDQLRARSTCSTSATGMGLIALALASAPPHRLLSQREAAERVRIALGAALDWLSHDHGMMAHFIDTHDGVALGSDPWSTIDSAWLIAGGLWAATFLRDRCLETLALRLYERVDWSYWSSPDRPGDAPLIRHGKDRDGRFIGNRWDRLNGETIFMYVLAAGAAEDRALPRGAWQALQPFYGTLAGHRFHSADLGLFVFQYGLDLLDLRRWQAPGELDLMAEAATAAAANYQVCRAAVDNFTTYRSYWGLSAGDGPGDAPATDVYRIYTPAEPLDGTAHLTATLASAAHLPDAVLENVNAGVRDRKLCPLGRYGFSSVNLDRGWIGRDMIGIDAGAAVLALDNLLADGRVRDTFHEVPCVRRGVERLGFVDLMARRRAS